MKINANLWKIKLIPNNFAWIIITLRLLRTQSALNFNNKNLKVFNFLLENECWSFKNYINFQSLCGKQNYCGNNWSLKLKFYELPIDNFIIDKNFKQITNKGFEKKVPELERFLSDCITN